MTKNATVPVGSTAAAHRPRLALSAAAAALVVGAVVTAVVVIGDDDPAAAAPLSQVQASCTDWMKSASEDARSDDSWCADMFAWMEDGSTGSMMGNMMWQGSQEMGAACREWVLDEPGETRAGGPQQCDAMVEWMNAHMPSQGGRWMMQNR